MSTQEASQRQVADRDKLDTAEGRIEYLREVISETAPLAKEVLLDGVRGKNFDILIGKHASLRHEIWWQLSTLLLIEILQAQRELLDELRFGKDPEPELKKPAVAKEKK